MKRNERGAEEPRRRACDLLAILAPCFDAGSSERPSIDPNHDPGKSAAGVKLQQYRLRALSGLAKSEVFTERSIARGMRANGPPKGLRLRLVNRAEFQREVSVLIRYDDDGVILLQE
jgi:hypothetical protein